MNNDRRDLRVNNGKLQVHPDKVRAMKERIRKEITTEGLERLWHTVVDEELESHLTDIVLEEEADEMRVKIRSMLSGVR